MLRREFAALADQEREEENAALGLLAVMQKKKREKVESGHWVVCRESTLSHFVFLLPLGKKLEEDQMYFLGLWTPAVSWVMLIFTVAVIGGASSEENDFVPSSKISEAIGLFL